MADNLFTLHQVSVKSAVVDSYMVVLGYPHVPDSVLHLLINIIDFSEIKTTVT